MLHVDPKEKGKVHTYVINSENLYASNTHEVDGTPDRPIYNHVGRDLKLFP